MVLKPRVVARIHAFPQLASDAYMSCASSLLRFQGKLFTAAILLDARRPATVPPVLPNSTATPGDPHAFNVPSPSISPRLGPITGQRTTGGAWLVVQSAGGGRLGSLAQRMMVLSRLRPCIHLTGVGCRAHV
jgi:hypothetical protein